MREKRTGMMKPRLSVIELITAEAYPEHIELSGKITQEELDYARESCVWKHNQLGVDICTLNLTPCLLEVSCGRCDTLKQLFAKKAKEKTNEE